MKKSSYMPPVPEHQADATLNQVNPVTGTFYPILAETKNVRIISIAAVITWATTQPTPLRIRVIIDGQTHYFDVTDPVSATWYHGIILPNYAENNQLLTPVTTEVKGFLLEGRTVQIDAQITWAVTQPTPLTARVKYARW